MVNTTGPGPDVESGGSVVSQTSPAHDPEATL